MLTLQLRTYLRYFVAVIVLFFVVHRLVYVRSNFIEGAASLMVYPIIKMQHAIVNPLQHYFKKRKDIAVLEEKIIALENNNANLKAENIKLQSMQKHEEVIQEMVKFSARYDVNEKYLAHIIMKEFSDCEQFFLVDQGSMHDITVDMIAVYKNCLVGRVTHVYPYYSKVMVVTDSRCKVAAYCHSSKAHGIHEGCNKKNYTTLQFVSHLHNLKKDDLITSSGEGLVFLQGFGLGRLDSFEHDGLYYKINVKPLIKFSELEFCYLIKKGQAT